LIKSDEKRIKRSGRAGSTKTWPAQPNEFYGPARPARKKNLLDRAGSVHRAGRPVLRPGAQWNKKSYQCNSYGIKNAQYGEGCPIANEGFQQHMY
jgi:hypothetical protein